MSLNITELSKLSKEAYNSNKGIILDIILFGSSTRGKTKPNDIDILMLFNEKIDRDIEYDFKKKIAKIYENVALISKTKENLNDPTFSAREAILFEGRSLLTKTSLASKWGFDPIGLFIYDTKPLKNTEKTRFYYAFNGRKGVQGIADSLRAIKLSDRILAVPLEEIEKAKEFFDFWKMSYTYIPTLLPTRLAKSHIIGKVR